MWSAVWYVAALSGLANSMGFIGEPNPIDNSVIAALCCLIIANLNGRN